MRSIHVLNLLVTSSWPPGLTSNPCLSERLTAVLGQVLRAVRVRRSICWSGHGMSEARRHRAEPDRLCRESGAAGTRRVPGSSRPAAHLQRSDGLPTRSSVLRARDRRSVVVHGLGDVEQRALGDRPLHADDCLPWISTTAVSVVRHGRSGSSRRLPPDTGRQHGGLHAPGVSATWCQNEPERSLWATDGVRLRP